MTICERRFGDLGDLPTQSSFVILESDEADSVCLSGVSLFAERKHAQTGDLTHARRVRRNVLSIRS